MNVTYNAAKQTFRFQGEAVTTQIPGLRSYTRESLQWAAFDARNGELVQKGTGSSCNPTDAQLQAWQEAASQYATIWAARLDDLSATLYIRYGDLPKGGRSTNYTTGRKENGVSVYAAKYDIETGAIVFDDEAGVHNPGTLAYLMDDRTPHLVTGQEAGAGSDGETLLRKVRIVANLRYDAKKGGFEIA